MLSLVVVVFCCLFYFILKNTEDKHIFFSFIGGHNSLFTR